MSAFCHFVAIENHKVVNKSPNKGFFLARIHEVKVFDWR